MIHNFLTALASASRSPESPTKMNLGSARVSLSLLQRLGRSSSGFGTWMRLAFRSKTSVPEVKHVAYLEIIASGTRGRGSTGGLVAGSRLAGLRVGFEIYG